jgi:hypothetical protein
MKLFYMLTVIIFWSTSLAWSKPFPGHVHYEVKYSKEYTGGKHPREYEVDFYSSKNKKAIVTKAGLKGNEQQVFIYIFDEEKKIMTFLDMKEKTYSLNAYESLPISKISDHKPLNPSNAMEILGEKLFPIYFKNDQTNLTYSVWYSSYTVTPFLMNRLDIERIIEPKTGRVALILTREVAKDINAIYIANNVDSIIPKNIFDVPATFKKRN